VQPIVGTHRKERIDLWRNYRNKGEGSTLLPTWVLVHARCAMCSSKLNLDMLVMSNYAGTMQKKQNRGDRAVDTGLARTSWAEAAGVGALGQNLLGLHPRVAAAAELLWGAAPEAPTFAIPAFCISPCTLVQTSWSWVAAAETARVRAMVQNGVGIRPRDPP